MPKGVASHECIDIVDRRELESALADLGLVAIRQALDEVMDVRGPRGRLHLIPTGLRSAIGDVVPNGAGEDHWCLGHQGHAFAQGLQGPLGQGHPFQGDLALLRIVKTHDQVKQGGFTRARWRRDDKQDSVA